MFCNTEGEEEYLAYTTEEGNEMSRFNAKEIEHVVKDFILFLLRLKDYDWFMYCVSLYEKIRDFRFGVSSDVPLYKHVLFSTLKEFTKNI